MTTFRVYGIPAPQGSKRAFVVRGKAVMVDGSSDTGRDKLSSWRNEVTTEALNVSPPEPIKGGVSVDITFFMPKPKSAPQKKMWCDKKPDIDKLVRATLDSMTGFIFNDDGQVCLLAVSKLYATPEEPAGARIAVAPLVP